MVKITIYQDKEENIKGFDCIGHADYADEGSDIVCAAVSVLTINCINSIESFTECGFKCEEDQNTGRIHFELEDMDGQAELLLRSLVLGLKDTECNYREYLQITFQEV